MKRRLYKSENDKIILGVCGGIAEYFEIDPVIVRIMFLLFGVTLLLYLVLAIIIPSKPKYL